MSFPSIPPPPTRTPPDSTPPAFPVLLPLLPPPASSQSQQHPAPPACVLPGYTTSHHLLPAAFPRSYPSHATSSHPDKTAMARFPPAEGVETREERKARVERETREIIAGALGAVENSVDIGRGEGGKGHGVESVVRRLVKHGRERGKRELTLVFGHANGLPPEDWLLPLQHAIHHLSSSSPKVSIVEIWLFSSPLTCPPSDSPLASSYTWKDHARDITSFIYHYLPLSPTSSSSSPLPYHLPRRPFPARRSDLIGIGHSWSGTSFLLAELHLEQQLRSSRVRGAGEKKRWEEYREGVWDGLMLVDPMVLDPAEEYYWLTAVREKEDLKLMMTMGRRDVWPSRATAKLELLKSPFFQAFHRSQFESYIQAGLRPLRPADRPPSSSPPCLTTTASPALVPAAITDTFPFVSSSPLADADEGPVTLSCPRWAETLIFADADFTIPEVYERLRSGQGVGRRCKGVRWVEQGNDQVTGPSNSREQLIHFLDSSSSSSSSSAGSCCWNSNVNAEDSGHLIVQERPEAMGLILAEWLQELDTRRGGKREQADEGREKGGRSSKL